MNPELWNRPNLLQGIQQTPSFSTSKQALSTGPSGFPVSPAAKGTPLLRAQGGGGESLGRAGGGAGVGEKLGSLGPSHPDPPQARWTPAAG